MNVNFKCYEEIGCSTTDLYKDFDTSTPRNTFDWAPFIDPQGTTVKVNSSCYIEITILPEFTGQPLDDLLYVYVTAFKPTAIRVVNRGQTLDAMPGRITISVDKNNLVEKITQEVSVANMPWSRFGADIQYEKKRRGL